MLFYLVFGLWAFGCLGFVSYDVRWGAFWLSVVASIVAAVFLGFNIFMLAWSDPIKALQLVSVYACVGLVWGSIKFFIRLRKARAKYVKDKAEWLAGRDLAPRGAEPEERTDARWIKHVKDSYSLKGEYAPTVAESKYDIMFWVCHWPFSMIAFVLEDFVRELWNVIWKMIKGFMEGIRKAALGDAAKDLD